MRHDSDAPRFSIVRVFQYWYGNPYRHWRNLTKRTFHRASGDATTNVYTRITGRTIADLGRGVRPWNAWHLHGRIVRPLRYNGMPYSGINVLMLWLAADENGFTSPIHSRFVSLT